MNALSRPLIALGGIGGDAHSVGLGILRHALTGNHYDVHFMGIQNPLEAFFRVAGHVDVVMVSCMDGHLRHYLAEFPDLRRRYPNSGALWYVGGNPTLGDRQRLRTDVRALGFSRVFSEYIDTATVLDALVQDLTMDRPQVRPPAPAGVVRVAAPGLPPSDDQVPRPDFDRERREVLETWRTGWEARDLDDNARFLRRQPSFAGWQASATRSGIPLLQPRSGVALVEEQLAAFRSLRRAGAGVLSYQVDSLTRDNSYSMAAQAIVESAQTGSSALNGYPMVNHGVRSLRQISSELRVPLQTRHSTRDPRLLAEISCAGGVTGFEGGAISYNVPYFKDYPLPLALRRWQYVDRLAGVYAEQHGVVIDREFFGTLTATLVPPCLAITVNLIEAVLAVKQGVRSVSLGYAEQGNRVQDVAAVRVLRELGEKYLANLGYPNVQINTVFHQYMAAFPSEAERAGQLIKASARTARLAGATRVLVKTPVEAVSIPDIEDNATGLRLCRQGVELSEGGVQDEIAVRDEMVIIRTEVEQLFESVLVCGDGSMTAGVIRAFDRGHLDIPFAPNIANRGDVLTARDVDGAVRFIRPGGLRLSADVVQFHRDKMEQRRHAEGVQEIDDWKIVERDVLRVPENRYRQWPLTS